MCNREQDLKEWQDIENKFADILRQRNPWCTIVQPEGYFKDYDLKLIKQDAEEITFEIKYDRMSADTGNVAIEISYNWKPSGIFSSTSDYIVYYITGDFRCIRRQTLIQKLEWSKTIRWWDNSLSELILIKKNNFISRCTQLWQ
jgi:hypothetical protein